MSKLTNIFEPSLETSTSNTIYINPRFRNAHINPNFLPRKQVQTPQPFNIHINPLFLPSHTQPITQASNQLPSQSQPKLHLPKASIISQTNRKLVRQPIHQTPAITRTAEPPQHTTPLVKIGKRKLVRAEQLFRVPLANSNNIPDKPKSTIKVLQKTAYSIDRRNGPQLPIKRNLYKINNQLNENLKSTRVVVTDRRLLRMYIYNIVFISINYV